MKCKLTGTENNGVEAHIIPKSFYRIDPDEKLPTKLVSDAKDHFPKRVPKGIYDKTIVTIEGEQVFKEWDDYAARLLIAQKDELEPLQHSGNLFAYQLPKYDYKKLKLFFLSVLWKASASSQKFFENVDLGPHETPIRNALLAGDPQDSDWYSVCIAKWSGDENGYGILSPSRARYDSVNYYRIYLESYIVYLKIDKRNPGEALRSVQLYPDRPLIVLARDLSKSKEFPIMVDMVK